MSDKLPIGTRIVFVNTLDVAACGDHPEMVYAHKGDEGEGTGYNEWEGYWVKRDAWNTPFGAEIETEFIELKISD